MTSRMTAQVINLERPSYLELGRGISEEPSKKQFGVSCRYRIPTGLVVSWEAQTSTSHLSWTAGYHSPDPAKPLFAAEVIAGKYETTCVLLAVSCPPDHRGSEE